MKLNLGSLYFRLDIETGGGTPAWGTELGQGEGYKFSFEDSSNFLTGMLYNIRHDMDEIYCPLGKGGNQGENFENVIASLFDNVYVNGKHIKDGRFLLLIVKLIRGEHHVGRRTLKYNPRITYHNEAINEDCYEKMEDTLGISHNAAWFVDEINIKNQDELHFTAYVLDKKNPVVFQNSSERKKIFEEVRGTIPCKEVNSTYRPYITAIKSKPFLLLAGISGTGKSRIVRELARACWDEDDDEYKAQKPRNFEMVQIKPNWHDSTELIGYVTRVSGNPEYVAGDFLKFVARAWEETDVPYFLCLDEMNLAPVEQYFAEYLSVVESRKKNDNGEIVTDPIIEPAYKAEDDLRTGRHQLKEWYRILIDELLAQCPTDKQFALTRQFETEGISLPPNLIVVGTVNMDETTFSFSRKVLDRAMTIEMNEVDLFGGLEDKHEHIGKLSNTDLIGDAVEGVDVYATNKNVCDIALDYLQNVNNVLEGTPFKIAYRTRNEFLLYVVNNLPYNKDKDDNELAQGYVIARALDEITNMKILPRIDGDDTKVTDDLLNTLKTTIEDGLKNVMGDDSDVPSVSQKKLDEMKKRLQSGYTSYWS